MKKTLPANLEKLRIDHPMYGKPEPGSIEGCFGIPYENNQLFVISGNGDEWRAIKEYEDLYEVSASGRVRALAKEVEIPNGAIRKHEEIELSQEKTKKGYMRVTLQNDGRREKILVHRLVAEAFIENKYNFPEINHINTDKAMNCVENIEWCSHEYNQHHAIENGLRSGLKILEIKEIKKMFDSGLTPTQVAEKLNCHPSSMFDIKHNRHRDLDNNERSGWTGPPFWDHVSVSLKNRCPNWREMCFIKNLFFEPDELVIQFHPPEKDYINLGKTVLHMWRPWNQEIELPPIYMV